MSHIDYSGIKECSSVCHIVGCGYSCKSKEITQAFKIIKTEIKCSDYGCLHSFTNFDDYNLHIQYHIKNDSKIIRRIIENNSIINIMSNNDVIGRLPSNF